MHKSLKATVINFKPLRKKLYEIYVTIINIHASTKEKEDELKDQYYKDLESTFEEILTSKQKIILENVNAKLGKE